jgi:hypothetical protein
VIERSKSTAGRVRAVLARWPGVIPISLVEPSGTAQRPRIVGYGPSQDASG